MCEKAATTDSGCISREEFHEFCRLLRDTCGLMLGEQTYARVAEIRAARLSELGTPSFGQYRRRLTSPSSRNRALAVLATKLTVGETYFFRNQDHWRALQRCVVPWLLHSASGAGRPGTRTPCAATEQKSRPQAGHWS